MVVKWYTGVQLRLYFNRLIIPRIEECKVNKVTLYILTTYQSINILIIYICKCTKCKLDVHISLHFYSFMLSLIDCTIHVLLFKINFFVIMPHVISTCTSYLEVSVIVKNDKPVRILRKYRMIDNVSCTIKSYCTTAFE